LKTRVLAVFPLLFAGAFLVTQAVASDDLTPTLMRVENESGKVLCLLGCLAAAFAFQRGDYLRLAWIGLAGCEFLLLARDVTLIPTVAQHVAESSLAPVRASLMVLANAAAVLGTWILARAWRVAGLQDLQEDGARRTQAALFVVGLAGALLVEGWPVVEQARGLFAGDLRRLPELAPELCDAICFALVVPVLQTALALRGGALIWPWALLTASGFCWMLYDIAYGAAFAHHPAAVASLRIGSEAFRALATTFTAAAGIAQVQALSLSAAARSRRRQQSLDRA